MGAAYFQLFGFNRRRVQEEESRGDEVLHIEDVARTSWVFYHYLVVETRDSENELKGKTQDFDVFLGQDEYGTWMVTNRKDFDRDFCQAGGISIPFGANAQELPKT